MSGHAGHGRAAHGERAHGEPPSHATPTRYEPATAEALAAIVRDAFEARLALLPEGLGTRGPLGALPARADAIVSTRALDGVVHYEPGDLTISVEAGMPLATLDGLLRPHGQRLGARPFALTGSIGGLIMSGAEGALALQHGGIRDVILGARTCHGDGLLARSRGRVVKNVAGYDVPRLLVGSLGSLGVLVEASLRLAPIPERRALCVMHFADADDAFVAARRVLDGPLDPALVDVLATHDGQAAHANPARASATRLLVLLEGRPARVDGELTRLAALLGGLRPESHEVLHDGDALPLLRLLDDPVAGLHACGREARATHPDAPHAADVRDLPGKPAGTTTDAPTAHDAHVRRLVVRLQRRPRTLLADLRSLLGQAREASLSARWLARPGLGTAVVDLRPSADVLARHAPLAHAPAHAPAPAPAPAHRHAHMPRHDAWIASAATLLDGPRRAAGMTVLEAPGVLRDPLRVFGPPPSAFALMRAVKLALDPRDVLAPGRCVGGL